MYIKGAGTVEIVHVDAWYKIQLAGPFCTVRFVEKSRKQASKHRKYLVPGTKTTRTCTYSLPGTRRSSEEALVNGLYGIRG